MLNDYEKYKLISMNTLKIYALIKLILYSQFYYGPVLQIALEIN